MQFCECLLDNNITMDIKQHTWTGLLLFVSIGVILDVQGEFVQGDLVHFNSGVQFGSSNLRVYNNFFPISIVNCINKCKRIKSCEFITYTIKFKRCALLQIYNSNKAPTILTRPEHGKVYGNKMEWDLSSVPVECATCTDYEECVTSSPTNHTCVRIGCGKRIQSKDAQRQGNLFGIDNKLKYTCNNNNMSVTSVCQSDEQWTNTNFSCEYCSLPTNTTEPTCIPTTNVQYMTGTFNDQPIKYYISTDVMNKQEAETYCLATCGQLIEVYTVEKFQYFVGVLQAHNDGNSHRYLIDAEYNDVDKLWYTSHGHVVPKTPDMWYSESASDGSTPCASFVARNFYLKDNSCDGAERFICERV